MSPARRRTRRRRRASPAPGRGATPSSASAQFARRGRPSPSATGSSPTPTQKPAVEWVDQEPHERQHAPVPANPFSSVKGRRCGSRGSSRKRRAGCRVQSITLIATHWTARQVGRGSPFGGRCRWSPACACAEKMSRRPRRPEGDGCGGRALTGRSQWWAGPAEDSLPDSSAGFSEPVPFSSFRSAGALLCAVRRRRLLPLACPRLSASLAGFLGVGFLRGPFSMRGHGPLRQRSGAAVQRPSPRILVHVVVGPGPALDDAPDRARFCPP